MKFTEFVDRVLVKLYELDGDHPGEFQNLALVAEAIKDSVPPSWIFDAGKVLDTRGFADVLFTFGGTDAKISGEGRLYVEEGRGTTQDIQAHPQNYYVTISGNNNQVAAGSQTGQMTQTITIEQERAPAFALVDDAINKLNNDSTLGGPKKLEAVTYANLIKAELAKSEPNKNLISAVIEPLSKISSIAGSIASLVKMFNAIG